MFHPTPLPVSLVVSSGDYARGVYAAEGQLRLEERALVLEYRVRDMSFRLGPVREGGAAACRRGGARVASQFFRRALRESR